jgi:hypothetical protein
MRASANLFIVASVAALIVGAMGGAQAQPVNAMADVAGKWSGVGSRGGKTDIQIEPNGKFSVESPAGKGEGTAKIEGGSVVLPFANNQGQIKFTKTGDVLEGPYVWGTMTGTVRVTRVGK